MYVRKKKKAKTTTEQAKMQLFIKFHTSAGKYKTQTPLPL